MQILTFNVRDEKSKDWRRFWIGIKGEAPVARFGFRMCVSEFATAEQRITTECIQRMKWATAILRAEDDALRRTAYQAVRDCKSHRAMVGAAKSGDVVRRNYEEIAKGVVLDW